MDVSSECTMVRTMGRSAYAPEVLSGRNRGQNRGKTQNLTQCIGVARNRSGQHRNKRRERLHSVFIKFPCSLMILKVIPTAIARL